MSLEENKAVVRRVYEELMNERNLALADELAAPDSVNHESPPDAPGFVAGPEGVRGVVRMLDAGFPDFHFDIHELIAEDDRVVAYVTLSGTHRGEFMGIAPTGRRFSQRQMHIMRLDGGRIAEHWAVRDDLGTLQQLGVISAPNR